MNKIKKVRNNFSLRKSTDDMLREYDEESGLNNMSLIVDLAVEEYIARKRKDGK